MVGVMMYCHEKKVLHRDIKPENIILGQNNQIIFIDFGVAKIFEKKTNTSYTFRGTPVYLSPEMIQQKKYSFKIDIWCLGMIIYELMMLHRPFDDPNLDKILSKICFEDLPPITQIYSTELIEIVKGMLAKDQYSRLSLRKIRMHPTLWKDIQNDDEILKEKVENLEKEMTLQKAINKKLKSQVQDLEKMKKELFDQTSLFQHKIQQLEEKYIGFKGNDIELQDQIKMVEEGMKILRNNLFDYESRKKAFSLFKRAADEYHDIEACWRLSACYLRSIGTVRDNKEAQKYAQKAMDAKSVEGIFWFGRSQEKPEKGFEYYKQANDKNHLAGKFCVGVCLYNGHGSTSDQEKGKKMIDEVLSSGDKYWTIVHGYCIENSEFGFQKNSDESNQLYNLSKSQTLSDNSVFLPFYADRKLGESRLKYLQ